MGKYYLTQKERRFKKSLEKQWALLKPMEGITLNTPEGRVSIVKNGKMTLKDYIDVILFPQEGDIHLP